MSNQLKVNKHKAMTQISKETKTQGRVAMAEAEWGSIHDVTQSN